MNDEDQNEECIMPISEWEDCVRDGLFTNDDGYGYFYNPNSQSELPFPIYPSAVGMPKYERVKELWTHIKWFNR